MTAPEPRTAPADEWSVSRRAIVRALKAAPSTYVLYTASRGPISVSGDSYGQPVPYTWLRKAIRR